MVRVRNKSFQKIATTTKLREEAAVRRFYPALLCPGVTSNYSRSLL
jgi:hypothetical protein